jgi:hypothetical protein
MNHIVTTDDGQFCVFEDDHQVAGPFATEAEAWAWIDRHGKEGRADSDRHNRIRQAFS